MTLLTLRLNLLGDPIERMMDSALDLSLLKAVLEDVRAAVERDGEVTDAVLDVIRLAGKSNQVIRKLEELRQKWQQNAEGLEPEAARARHRQEVMSYLGWHVNFVDMWKTDYERWEASEKVAQQTAAVLPSAETLEKIERYEARMGRALHRALNQLERLQRRRLGEAVPAPVSVVMSERL